MISIIEICQGVGSMIGPIIGAELYAWGGFVLPFFVTGGIMLLISPFLKWAIPERADLVIDNDKGTELSYWRLLKIKWLVLAMIGGFFADFALALFEPILANRLKDFLLTEE